MQKVDALVDIIIVGGGLVGSLLALALQPLKLKVAIIEAQSITDFVNNSKQDKRSIALSVSSWNVLSALNVATAIDELAIKIKNINVSSQGKFAATDISAVEHGMSALGYVIKLHELQQELQKKLVDNVKIISPAKVIGITQTANKAQLEVETDSNKIMQYEAKLVLAADGSNSSISKLLAIKSDVTDYEQMAVVANVTIKQPHEDKAFERFTADGALALLPLENKLMSLVWSVPNSKAKEILKLNKNTFLKALQLEFGYRVGKFVDVGERKSFPVKLIIAKQQYMDRVLLFGNAAHSLHPIAGQGFNLCVRDVANFVECLQQRLLDSDDIDSTEVLQAYVKKVKPDQQQIVDLTNNMVQSFARYAPVTSTLRNSFMLTLQYNFCLNKIFTRHMAGMRQSRSRLSRGLSYAR